MLLQEHMFIALREPIAKVLKIFPVTHKFMLFQMQLALRISVVVCSEDCKNVAMFSQIIVNIISLT